MRMPDCPVDRAWRRRYGLIGATLAALLVLAASPLPGNARTRHPMDALTGREVDRAGGRIASIVEVEGELGLIIDGWLAARELTMADPRCPAAIDRRGITDLRTVTCSPITAGYFRDDCGGRRILKAPCYEHRTGRSHLYGRSIEAVFTIVDVEAREVIDVVDLGTVELAEGLARARWSRPPLKPVVMSSPQGAKFKISRAVEISWASWSFHTRMGKQAGPAISLVRFGEPEPPALRSAIDRSGSGR